MSSAAKVNQTIRKSVNLTIRKDLLADAKDLALNLSRAAEDGIAQAVRRRKEAVWREENKSAVDAYNELIEADGLPLDEHRLF